jgi:hypothetical protein
VQGQETSWHDILRMPLYFPDLQQVGRFWPAGKEHVTDEFENANLRDEWCGNKHKLSAQDAVDPNILLEPSVSGKLAEHAIKMVNQWFIGMAVFWSE